ncbi:hypothetical protein SL103_20500 [Streptomyces lydicus]|uniref:Uncharacterized protein n=1 Tax=Streptomyces lydicus TaxID=47763 RepID=A0A1D7VNH4_9ACTN|nr:hypothetical protein SL103_20500 [Streptomyces lydicus]
MAHTDRTGIGTPSTWGRRPAHPNGPGTSFSPITGLSVHHNTVRDAGGDGIVVQNAVGARVEHHLVDGYNARSAGYNAGMISDRNTVRYNVSVNDRNTTAPYGVISVVCASATRTLVHHNTVTTNVPGTAVVSSNGPGASPSVTRLRRRRGRLPACRRTPHLRPQPLRPDLRGARHRRRRGTR